MIKSTVLVTKINRYVILALLLFNLHACSQVMPLQEISDAHQAIQIAQDNNVEAQLPDSLAQAQRYLIQAEAALSVGETKLAKQQAVSAKQSALYVYQTAQILSETQTLLSTINPNTPQLNHSKHLIQQAIQACEQQDMQQAKTLAAQALQAAQATSQPDGD